MKRWVAVFLSLAIIASLPLVPLAKEKSPAEKAYKRALARWQKTIIDPTKKVKITVTYYSIELVRAIVNYEAEKNLWTRDEIENFKYRFLKNLRFADCLPFKIKIVNYGPAMHMGPFGKKLKLIVGGKEYSPVDYDKIFNFKLLGERDGMVFFPRRDKKTGREIITPGAKMLTLIISRDISPVTAEKAFDFCFRWSNPYEKISIEEYTAGEARVELERLNRRIELLLEKKKDLLEKIKKIEEELRRIRARIAELEKIIYGKQ
ncbi:MAG: hypothetical protein J7M13_07235 [Synergistetes bacterium]|nr:hypothetical protein [Synergistota bacterium]